jgi:hypothetical protein
LIVSAEIHLGAPADDVSQFAAIFVISADQHTPAYSTGKTVKGIAGKFFLNFSERGLSEAND